MGFTTKVTLDLPNADEIIRSVGLDARGAAQRFHTQNVLRRIVKFMPKLTNALINRTIASTVIDDNEITTPGSEVNYLYHGVAMEGDPRMPTERPLNYTTDFNPQAGPFWDRALVAAEGDILVQELQEYIDSLAGGAK